MPSSFIDLPPKVVELIFSFLDKNDRKSLALVSKAIYKIFQQYEVQNTVELSVIMKKRNFKQLDEDLNFLNRFPNLKRIHISFEKCNDCSKDNQLNLAGFREFVDNWSIRLDEIEITTNCWDTEQMLKAFEEWNNEKLTFGHVQLLEVENIESIKWFFSHPRRIKCLEEFGPNEFPDKALFDLINRNAIIERLDVLYLPIQSNSIPNVFFNMNGVKEIDLHLIQPPVKIENFTPEALLKVTELTDVELHRLWDNEDFANLPHFQNLRKLELWDMTIFDDDMKFMVENFPNLEEIFIRDFRAYGGTIFSGLQSLKKVRLGQAIRLSDKNLIVGFNLPNLTSLKIRGARNATLTGIKRLMANCPKLEEFHICGDKIDDVCKVYIEENLRKPEPK